MPRKCTFFIALLLASLSGAHTSQARTWNSATGTFQIEAELVEKRADGTVVLKRADGVTIETKLEKLSAADQDYIKQWNAPPVAKESDPFEEGATPISGQIVLNAEQQAALGKIKSSESKAAVLAYQQQAKVLHDTYAAKQKEYREKLASLLEEALKEAAVAGDLDDALAIRTAIQALKAGQEPVPSTQLNSEVAERPPAKPARIPKHARAFGGRHYLLVLAPENKADAQAKCEAEGGHLIRIDSKAKLAFAQRLVSTVNSNKVWIDGSDEVQARDWRFSDGRKMTSFNWRAGAPDNSGDDEHHIHIRRDGLWEDSDGGLVIPYICEWDK